jgi:hypothetical protein
MDSLGPAWAGRCDLGADITAVIPDATETARPRPAPVGCLAEFGRGSNDPGRITGIPGGFSRARLTLAG